MDSAAAFYTYLVEPGDLCFDIGANVGEHSRAMMAAGGTVIAVEPQPDLAERLLSNVGLTVVERAVIDTAGIKLGLHTSSQHPHMATVSTGWQIESGEPEGMWDGVAFVETTTLANLIRDYGVPKLLKIDTEGCEHMVLDTLGDPVERIMFEVHGKLPAIARECFDIIETKGDYEYRLMVEESWKLTRPATPGEILARLPQWGDVLAERVA